MDSSYSDLQKSDSIADDGRAGGICGVSISPNASDKQPIFLGLTASSSNDESSTCSNSCASCSSGGITHPSVFKARKMAPGE